MRIKFIFQLSNTAILKVLKQLLTQNMFAYFLYPSPRLPSLVARCRFLLSLPGRRMNSEKPIEYLEAEKATLGPVLASLSSQRLTLTATPQLLFIVLGGERLPEVCCS